MSPIPTLALIYLLAQCPAYNSDVPVNVLKPPAFAELAELYGVKPEGGGFAVWHPGLDGPEDCRIWLRAPADPQVGCHEYRHCAEGHFHK